MQDRIRREMPSVRALERELEELENLLNQPDKYPVLFCHGNLGPANIILDPLKRTVVFINLEFASFNFQAFELAQVFNSFAGGDLDKVGRAEFVPAKEFQMRWLQSYLAGYKATQESNVSY